MGQRVGTAGIRVRRSKVAVLATASAVSVLLGALVWTSWPRPVQAGGSVELVDQRAEIIELLASRRRRAGSRGPLEAARPSTAARTLLREPLDLETAQRFFPELRRSPERFCPQAFFRYRGPRVMRSPWKEHPAGGWLSHHNDLGMREVHEPASERPDQRVLVTGDSHTEGVCGTQETFPNVLEALLRERHPDEQIEVLNAGKGGYNLYNYVGVLETFLELEPDVYVVCVYGGNDFYTSLLLQRYFHRRGPPEILPWNAGLLVDKAGGLPAQELLQTFYFLNNPDDVPVAVETMVRGSREIASICAAHGIAPLFAYLPPPTRGQPELQGRWIDEVLVPLGIAPQAVRVSDRIADAWLATVASEGIATLDLRPRFQARSEPLYWERDHHINVDAHRLIAEALLPLFAGPQARFNR